LGCLDYCPVFCVFFNAENLVAGVLDNLFAFATVILSFGNVFTRLGL
jgi:hypothetical protein